MQTTAQSILDGLQKAMLLRIERRPVRGRRSSCNYSGADLRAIRAQKGVGRPPMLAGWAKMEVGQWRGVNFITTTPLPMHGALHQHGSQRAAARALGLNLSTFQRRLAKEQAAPKCYTCGRPVSKYDECRACAATDSP
jgi:hypothetical protein